MNYQSLSDPELIEKFRSGDQTAWNFLYKRYERLIEAQPNYYFAKGAEADDIVVEGMQGFYDAVRSFDGNKGSFASFAGLCIGRRIQKFIDQSNSMYNSMLNEAMPFPDGEDENAVLNDNGRTNPEAIYLEKENDLELDRVLKESLTEIEYAVVTKRLDGFSYKEIAENLGLSEKAVDNALQRIRKNLRKS